ncbi:MAG: hypothetical protein PWR27_474, partial [Petroclostridium sp.]|nr:hypothetical protein [Petroclostridium sp.]
QGFDMGTVPQSHEKRIRQTNRPQVEALLPAEPDFFSGLEPSLDWLFNRFYL